jgi:hydrogenase maturation protease
MTTEASRKNSVLILGIGNLLWADEGFGVRCVERLGQQYAFDERVRLLDGGTQGLYLVNQLEGVEHLIIFDAVDYGMPPGTLKMVRDDQVPRFLGAKKMSLHQVGFQDVLAVVELLGQLPANMLLIGVQPEQLEDYGGSLSPTVKAMIEPALTRALEELAACNIQPLASYPQQSPENAHPHAALKLADYEHGRPSSTQAWRHGDARFVNSLR